jgi:hypothetical protein
MSLKRCLKVTANADSCSSNPAVGNDDDGTANGGSRCVFYGSGLRIPYQASLLRRVNAVIAPVFTSLHRDLTPYYSRTGGPSIDPAGWMLMPQRQLVAA